MLPLAELADLSPLAAFFGGTDEVCVDSAAFVQPFFLCAPPGQVRQFIFLFCVSAAIGLASHHAAAVRYYRWFVQADIPHNQVRGMAYNACKAYGLVPIPALSVPAFQMVFFGLLATVLLACHPGLAPRFFLFASIPLYFLYFGQLWCESKHGGHGSILLPSVFLLLALSGGPRSTPWSLVFIKVFVGMIYFAGGISKLVVSLVFGERWCGSTMQAYIFDAMFSRPHRLGAVRAFQRFCVTRWWVCTTVAIAGLIFEMAFLPLFFFGGHLGATVAALVAFAFHLGVDVLQGLDFKPFWCPVLWIFLPDVQAVLSGAPQQPWREVVWQGYEEEPFRWMLCALYLLVQAIVALGLLDLQDKECVPFTCCPMFAVPRNMFGDEARGGIMTDFSLRDAGYMDMAYNFSPWSSKLPLSQENLRQLPGKMMVWMNTMHINPKVKHILREEAHHKELLVMGNFEISTELRTKLNEFLQYLARCRGEDWAVAERAAEAVTLHEQCLALFAQDTRKARLAEEKAKPQAVAEDGSFVTALLACVGLAPAKR